MDKVARFSATDRRDLFNEVARRRNLSPQIIEKDFWVCWTLRRLFTHPLLRQRLIFKGGTSLSKVFRLIERFSEDLDLTIRKETLGFSGSESPEQGDSRKETQRRIKSLRAACHRCVREEFLPLLQDAFVNALGGLGKVSQRFNLEWEADDVLRFEYPAAPFGTPNLTSIARSVKLEFGASSDPEPIGTYSISPYAAAEFPDLFSECSETQVIALEAERSFWEKATILHAEHHRPPETLLPKHFPPLFRSGVDVQKPRGGESSGKARPAGTCRGAQKHLLSVGVGAL